MKNLLSDFGAAIGIPELQPDEENRCNLMFDEVAVSVELSPNEDSILVYTYLGDVSDTSPKALLMTLLHANYLFRGTAGATIGVDEATGRVVMVRTADLSTLRLVAFESLVEKFVNLAELWQKKLAGFTTEAEDETSSATPLDIPANKA